MKDVYVIIEGKDGRDIWQKIGTAFENRDGSLNIYLNCIPLSGKLHVRDRVQNGGEDKEEGE